MEKTALENLILHKLDELCSRITRLEQKFTGLESRNKSRKEKVMMGISIMTSITAVIAIIT